MQQSKVLASNNQMIHGYTPQRTNMIETQNIQKTYTFNEHFSYLISKDETGLNMNPE